MKFKYKLVAFVLFCVYKLFYFSWRIRFIESPGFKQLLQSKQNYVVAHWHQDILGILYLLHLYKIVPVASKSKDGDIISGAIRLMGVPVARGSSHRGGVQALKGVIGLAKRGWNASLAVDGPKGPIYKVKPGILQVSRVAKLPIVPVACAAQRSFVFSKSWDRGILPKPFTKIVVYWGEPLDVVTGDINENLEALQEQTKAAINQARLLASKNLSQ